MVKHAAWLRGTGMDGSAKPRCSAPPLLVVYGYRIVKHRNTQIDSSPWPSVLCGVAPMAVGSSKRNHSACCWNPRVCSRTLEPSTYLSRGALSKLEGRGSSPAAQSDSLMCHGLRFATTGRPTSAMQQSSTGRLGSRLWLACVISTSTSLPKRSMARRASRDRCSYRANL